MTFFEFFVTLFIAWHFVMFIGMVFASVGWTIWIVYVRAYLRWQYIIGKPWWKAW